MGCSRPAPLLERPQPVGFGLVGIITCRRRDQLRALFAEVVEAATQLFPGEREKINGPFIYQLKGTPGGIQGRA
jgi:hypothetical protein